MLFRLTLVLLTTVVVSGPAFGQIDIDGSLSSGSLFGAREQVNSIDLSAQLVQLDARTVELRVTATPPADFYIYSTTTPKGQKTRITLTETGGLHPAQQPFAPDHPPKGKYSNDFAGDVEKFTGSVTWSRQFMSVAPLSGTVRMAGNVSGQICTEDNGGDGGICVLLRPAPEFSAELVVDESAATTPTEVQSVSTDHPSSMTVTLDDESSGAGKIGYTVSLEPSDAQPGDEITLNVRADLAKGWHTYSVTLSPEILGGSPTAIRLQELAGLQSVDDEFTTQIVPELLDSPLGGSLEVHEQTVTWTRRFVVTDAEAVVAGTIEGQVCSDTHCLQPGTATFTVALGGEETATLPAFAADGDGDKLPTTDAVAVGVGVAADAREQGLLVFLLAAVGAGFVALLTPCVFPMIPVTVAFFLKQGESGQGNTKLLAVIYCLGIVGSFTIIGVLVSIVFGPQKMTEMANGPWLNLLFAVVFIAFALMLMGVFELRMPTSIVNWSSQRESGGGFVGVLFMALTFTLVSFTCTAAFVANVLVWASRGDIIWPTLGMLAFSTAFASPFFFLALFPGLLTQLPKSGGWMQKVKCTAGLIELAFVVKFLSVADIGFSSDATPRFLDFSSAMVLWATLAFVTGLYLLGVFRFSKDTPTEGISPIGGLWAMSSIGLGLLICVGLFSPRPPEGWVWNQLEGFAPPRFERDVLNDQFAELTQARNWLSHDGLAYALEVEDGVAVARTRSRPLFIDFTGVNCINCRTMEKSVLNQEEILDLLATVPRAQLYLDEIPTVADAAEEGSILERNRQLCEQLTGGAAMPTYVVLSPNSMTVLSATTGVVSKEAFREFLDAGIQRFEELQKSVHASAADRNRNDRQL
ncbi:MAG: thioredoxin family protein [Fuerstiella sp.]|nr:thioredoxin family protein [Fuerstiella sp.]